MSEEKTFGKHNDLVLLLLGFLLTVVIGGGLTQLWQEKSQDFERQAESLRMERAAATGLFEDLSRVMDRRLYHMRRLHWGIESDLKQEDLNIRWENYRQALFSWNENLNRNLSLAARYFGEQTRARLEGDIGSRFRGLGELLQTTPYSAKVQEEFEREADALNTAIYDFNVDLIKAIQLGTVGQFRDSEGELP